MIEKLISFTSKEELSRSFQNQQYIVKTWIKDYSLILGLWWPETLFLFSRTFEAILKFAFWKQVIKRFVSHSASAFRDSIMQHTSPITSSYLKIEMPRPFFRSFLFLQKVHKKSIRKAVEEQWSVEDVCAFIPLLLHALHQSEVLWWMAHTMYTCMHTFVYPILLIKMKYAIRFLSSLCRSKVTGNWVLSPPKTSKISSGFLYHPFSSRSPLLGSLNAIVTDSYGTSQWAYCWAMYVQYSMQFQ